MFGPYDELVIVRHCLESFGWDRCMAESNWFVSDVLGLKFKDTFDNIMEVCDAMGASQEQKDLVFYKNAERWYQC